MSDDAAKTTAAATAAPTMSDDAKTTVGTAPTRGRQLRVKVRRLDRRSQRSRGRSTEEEEMDRINAQVALHHRRGLLGNRHRQLLASGDS